MTVYRDKFTRVANGSDVHAPTTMFGAVSCDVTSSMKSTSAVLWQGLRTIAYSAPNNEVSYAFMEGQDWDGHSAGGLHIWIRFWSLPTDGPVLISEIRSSADHVALLRVDTTTNQFVVFDAAVNPVHTFPTPIVTGQWYRIELGATKGTTTSNGQIHAAIYADNNTTPIDAAYTGSAVNAGIKDLMFYRIGKWTQHGTLHCYLAMAGLNFGSMSEIGNYTGNLSSVAVAGADQTVEPWALTKLSGIKSYDQDGDALVTYAWAQTSGPAVTLHDASTPNMYFTAPALLTGATLTFTLTVTDSLGAVSSPDPVTVTVNSATEFYLDPSHVWQGVEMTFM